MNCYLRYSFLAVRDYNSSFFRVAKLGENGLPIYFIAFVVVVIGYILGMFPLQYILDSNDHSLESFSADMDFERFGINSNVGFVLLLLTFIGALIALFLMVRFAHQKRFFHLIKAEGRLNWSKMIFCFTLWIALTAFFELGMYLLGYNEYSFSFNFSSFIPLLLISFLVLPLQTSFEEFFFRSYYLQGLSLVFKNKWVPLIITSVFFGLVHISNPEVAKYGVFTMQFYYISVGLFLGILTILDDSLEIALGIHAATNFYGACFVGYEGSAIQTASLFKSGQLDTIIMILAFYLIAIIFYMIVSKRYKFPSLEYIFYKLDFNEHIT